jgi:mannose-1-phosphate guanylyltransferase
VIEPIRRDSGPAIAAGAAFARTRDPDAIVLATAADHVILETELFHDACRIDAGTRRRCSIASRVKCGHFLKARRGPGRSLAGRRA